MNDLNQSIKEAFDSIGLILVFVFVLFDIQYPLIVKDIEAKIPIAIRADDRRNHRRFLINSFIKNSLPMILINGVLLYLLLPLTIKVFQNSTLEIWNFDFLRTSLVAVFLFICFFFVWSIILGVRIIKKVYESR